MSVTSESPYAIYFALKLLTSLVVISHASHFRGGLVHLKTVGPISRTTGLTIDVTQRYGWRRSYGRNTHCDASTIGSRQIIGDVGYLRCRVGCPGSLSVGIFCTDFSVTGDWTVGERIQRISLPFASVMEASFASSAWIDSLVKGSGSSWEVRAKLNLTAILVQRTENASPETKMAPIINLLYGCNHTITIPVEDVDGDVVRCRWAESIYEECGGVCQAFPGAVLNERDCTMFYSATGIVGVYAVAIQIEDFYSTIDTVPLSSVPLQFIVNVYESPFGNVSCYAKPTFSWPTRLDGTCIGIPLHSTFQEAIIAESAGPGISIQDITTQSPLGVRKSDLAVGPGTNNWYVNITWTPVPSQVGNNIFCFTAVDSNGANSDQNCIIFAVGTYPPALKNGSLFPTGEVFPSNSNWRFEFDRQFVRPRRSAYIRFYDENDEEVFVIDTSISTNVTFPTSPTDFSLAFMTAYIFKEKVTYYITIDHGVVYGTEACGPESDGMFDPHYWRFAIKDVTPPVLTFLPYKMHSGGSINIAWIYDEAALSTCLIQGPLSVFRITCNDTLTLSNLTEGDFTLFVQASDVSGNSKQYHTSWYVDLKAPLVSITHKPPLVTNKHWTIFMMTCSDRSLCQLWCADHAPGQTEPTFINCSSTYTTSSVNDGVRAFTVYGVDDVGNVGERVTYTWTVDTTAPTIVGLPPSDITVACGSPYDPSRTGIPTYSDSTDRSLSLSYNDSLTTGCRTVRTWTVSDHAGNTANVTQTISFTNVIGPSVGGAEELFVPCGETDRLTSSDYVVKTLNVTSPCGRRVTVDYTNSRPITDCGITVTRQWRIMDDCNSVTYFTQTIHVLFQSFPDFPANGQMHASLYPRLGWPLYPQSQGFSVYAWQYGSNKPHTPTAFVPIWRRTYTFTDALPPNTRFLWRIGYIVPFGNGTREIPSPTWGFRTESYADLSLISVQAPPTAFSGSSFTVNWIVENVGNVSTSHSTSVYYDAIYLSRSTEFSDAYRTTLSMQHRYVDPQDGYTFSDDVNLQPSDVGSFYVFVVTDEYRYIADFTTANNHFLAVQPVHVKLTPPPNLQVKSANIVGFILSGQETVVRVTIENSGFGITQATRWYDRFFLSVDDQRSSDDQVLTTSVHSGALASGQRYMSSIPVTIPNAIYGDYHIIVSTDINQQVYEHTDDNDNDFALKISIVLSPYPDLVVSNITVPNVATTGDTIRVLAIVRNAGSGEPFEYSWKDGVKITSIKDGVEIFSATYRHIPGILSFVPGSTYMSLFEYTVAPPAESGEYNVTVLADVSNQVFEFQSNDNNQDTVVMRINQVLPDLILGPSSAVIIENGTGNYMTMSITILNIGPGRPQIQSWENTVILSTSRTTVQLTSLFSPNMFFQNHLVSNLTTRISSSVVGSFDVYVSIDWRNQVLEVNESNNYMYIGRVNLQERVPDLALISVRVTNHAQSGSTIVVEWTVENVGNLASRHQLSWFDEITLMAESGTKISLSRVLISFSDDLQPQQKYERQLNLTIPSNLAGLYRLGVTTALYESRNIGVELNQGNNYRETPIAVSTPPSPDFKPVSCSFEISSQFATRLLSVVCTIANEGNTMDKPMSWTDRISLVNFGGNAVLTTFVTGVRKLSFGDTYESSATMALSPAIDGYFQIAVQVDSSHNVTEIGGENNNAMQVSSVVYIPPGPSPRLSVSIEPLMQSVFNSGETLSVNCSVTNTGDRHLALSTWTDSLFVFPVPGATKQQVMSSGFLISSVINNYPLKMGASYSETFRGVLPYSIRGQTYVYVVTDVNDRLPIRAGFSDRAEHLNATISVQPGPLPDLQISLTGNLSIIRVQSGQVYELEFTVSNIGNASAFGIWYDSVYLSHEKLIDPFDIALKTSVRPRALGKGESYTHSMSFVIPFDLPAVAYYFIVTANVRREVFESSFDNNNDYQLTEIVVLPAVDLVVMNITSSVTNATYSENVNFQWTVANNGSIATFGYKCDSVYLSSDDVWHITDVTVVGPFCGLFSLDQKGSAADFSIYENTGKIPPVAKGSYKSIVRTRSNVKDYNLLNNIGVSVLNMSVNPPTISIGENKTYDFNTNEDRTFELTNIPVGIGLIVRLNTLYELAYHGLFIKRNSPPETYDYDVAYRQIGTTQQTVYLPYTKSGDYYLLVESASAAFKQSYQVSLSVKEAKFEVTGVYPSLLATAGATASIRISGTLFGRKLRAFLTNDSQIQTATTQIYRYTSEEAYATFNSRELSAGTYDVLLQDVGRNRSYELKDAVVVSGLAIEGKLQVDLVTPRALRPGRPGIIDVKIDNAGYSDVSMPLLLLTAEQNIKLLSTQSDVGVLPSENILFFPLNKNRPPSIILPKSTAVYSFRAIPDDEDFVGDVPISLYAAKDELVLAILRKFKLELKPSNVADDVWDIVWRNVERCFGSEPTSLLRTINGRFTQHYAAMNSVDNLIGHFVGVADGAVPRLVLSESVDVEDRSYSSSLILRIVRTYPQQLTVRKSVGLFGRSWSSPMLEMAVSVHANSVRLIKQRQEFTFTSMDDSRLYSNHRLPNDRIKINNTTATYISKGVSYVFDMNSGLLERITDETEVDFISITYDVNNMPVRLTHHSSGSTINLVYGSNGFISSTELMQSGVVLSKVYYSYNDDGYLTSVAGDSVTEYQYTAEGDLSLIVKGQRRTEITYDVMHLMAQTVDYYGDDILQELRIHRHCDGSIERTVLPQNLSSLFVFGLSGKLIENSADDGLPVNIRRDNVRDEVYVTVGDELKQTHSFDRSSRTYFIANANDEKLVVKLRPDGRVRSIGDTQSAYYSATYTGDRVSSVGFRDGKRQKFTYNDQGQRTSATLRDGSRITYSYDDKQYLSVVQTSSGRYVYGHNSDGLLAAVSAPDGGTTTLAYNRQRLPISVVYPDGTSLRYTYNECGQRSSVTSNTGYKSSYVYDSSCRLSKVVDASGSVVAAYEYGQHSQIAKKQLGNGMYTEYTYENGSLRLQQLRNFFPNGTLMSYYSYVHNEWGNRVETETQEGVWKYRYDAIGQLIEWRSPFSDEYENIEYSSNLNRKYKQTATDKSFYTTNSLHQYTKYGNAENFTYDVNGNLLSKSTGMGTRTYVERFAYDQLGHCTTVTAGDITCRYQHDVFGAVSAKTCSDGKYTKYLVDPFGTYGTNILAEQTESGHIKRMHYGQEHGLIASLESADIHDAVFYVFDGDGSTIQTGSQTGEILSSYNYDPFGRELSLSMDDVNKFRFLGLYGIPVVSETANIVRIRNRLYDSEHGRFISPDPTGVFGSPINPYTYAINSPLIFKDTNGLVPILPAVGLVGRTLLYKIGKEAVIGGIKGANNYLWKLHLSGDKFDWREFAKATGTSALNSAITSVNPFDSLSSKFVFSFVATLLTGGDLLDALESGAVNVIPKELRPFYDLSRAALDVYLSKHTDNRKLTDLIKNGFIRWVRSIDPNEITGPVGYGDANYISADQSLVYKIEFENNPNATAPAQKVIIRCPIDSNLELGTFKVGLVKFDVYEKDFQFRSSRVHLSRIDATDKTGTFVEVHVFIDPITKEAIWLLRSIDPLTGLPPSNPLVGFLPPNNGTNGQGYVTFSINIKRSAQSLSRITENANIVFDENPHIDTSTIFHTVDKTAGTVSMNVSTLIDGALVNIVTEDVGSGVKSVDLYLVVDGSLKLIKSDITQSVVIVELPENVRHTVVGVSTDNVGNSGTVDTSGSVDVYVPTDCPANCSGRGQCGSGGVCICDAGYAGYNCSLDLTLSCEPPILEVSYSDTVHNDSLVVFVSARSSRPEPATSLSVKIACVPNDTVLSAGRRRSDGVYYLEKTDFGNVLFTTPDWFHGLLVCTINATVVDVCGTNVRRILMVTDVVGPEDRTTVKTDGVTADHATAHTAGRDITTASMPITAATSSVQQSQGVSRRSRSATEISAHISQPGDRTTHRTTFGALDVTGKTRSATETSAFISQPGDRMTHSTTSGALGVTGKTRSATESSSYISQPGDRMTHSITSSALGVSGKTPSATESSTYISQPGDRMTHSTTSGALGVSGKTRSATETSTYISQPGDRMTHRTTSSALGVSGKTPSATESSSYISQPGDRVTHSTTSGALGVTGKTRGVIETSAYISQPGDRMTHSTTSSALGVTGKTRGVIETSAYISQPGDRTTHRTTFGASGASGKTRSATESSSYISQPGDRMTHSTTSSALGVTGKTRGVIETSAYISQPGDRTTHRTTFGALGVSGKTPSATESSSYISQPGDRMTHSTTSGALGASGKTRSATETSAYISQPGDRTTDRTTLRASVTITKVAVTQLSDISEGTTTAASWDAWSDWTPCSRSCDTGVQERTRQCLLSSPEYCGPAITDRRFCKLSTCPGMPSI